MRKDVLDKLDSLIEKNVRAYKTDWTEIDRPRVEALSDSDRFVVMLRETGVDTMFLSGHELDYQNLLWSDACLQSCRSDMYLYYDGKKIQEISVDEARMLYERVYSSIPQEYIEACESAYKARERSYTFEQWKTAKEIKLDMIGLKLAVSGHMGLAREYMNRRIDLALGFNPDDFTIQHGLITEHSLKTAEWILVQSGVEHGEADTVMQALGYVLMDRELYPENEDQELEKLDGKKTFTITDKTRKKAVKCLTDNGVPKKECMKVLDSIGKVLFDHRVSTIVEDLKQLGIKLPKEQMVAKKSSGVSR